MHEVTINTITTLCPKVRLFECQFVRNIAVRAGVVLMLWMRVHFEFYDCLFYRNEGAALMTWAVGDSQIVRCVFRENLGSGEAVWPGFGSAVVLTAFSDVLISISDSFFERNIGHAGGTSGGPLTLRTSFSLLTNVSFVSNTAMTPEGGATFDVQVGAKATLINCFALGNVAPTSIGGFNVKDSQLTVINSKYQRVIGKEEETTVPFCDLSLIRVTYVVDRLRHVAPVDVHFGERREVVAHKDCASRGLTSETAISATSQKQVRSPSHMGFMGGPRSKEKTLYSPCVRHAI